MWSSKVKNIKKECFEELIREFQEEENFPVNFSQDNFDDEIEEYPSLWYEEQLYEEKGTNDHQIPSNEQDILEMLSNIENSLRAC